MSVRVRRDRARGATPEGRDTSAAARAKRAERRRRRQVRAERPPFAERHGVLGAVGRLSARVGRLAFWPVVFVGTLALLAAISVFPTRSYFEHRERIAAAEEQLASATAANDELQQRADRLDDPDEIERLARSQYGLVKPGEEVYHVLPPAQDPVTIPDVWPFHSLADRLGATAGSTTPAPPSSSPPPSTPPSTATARPPAAPPTTTPPWTAPVTTAPKVSTTVPRASTTAPKVSTTTPVPSTTTPKATTTTSRPTSTTR